MAERRSFRAAEESTATGVRRVKRGDSRTEEQCRPTLTRPTGLSAHPPGRAGLTRRGGRGWELRLGRRLERRKTTGGENTA